MPTNNNVKVLDRKEWQMMAGPPIAATLSVFAVEPPSNLPRTPVLYVNTASSAYEYWPEEDAWMAVPNPSLGSVIGAGACGAFSPWSLTYTATGGNAAGTTVTVAASSFPLTSAVIGKTIEFLSVSNIGVRRVITGIDAQGDVSGSTITLTLDYAVGTQVTTNTFRISSGRFFVIMSGTLSATTQKQFDVATQAWSAVTNTGLPATLATDGAMVSTARHCPVLANGSASSGSTTTLVDTSQNWIVNQWAGMYVMMVSGTGAGQCLKILSNTATILTFATAVAPAAATIYQIRGGAAVASGVATSGSATTLVNSGKTWTVNQWTNYQCRILSGTGAGQKSKIASNTATTLTIASGATIDSTSVYEIEPLEDSIYLLGNNAVTMYLYSISGNSWSTVAPTTARGAAPVAGMSGEFVSYTGDPLWANESVNQEGRYIYSFRGGNANTLDRFDIAGGTAGAGAWANLPQTTAEIIASGACVAYSTRFLYIRIAGAAYRFLKYDIPGNEILPLSVNMFGDNAGTVGNKNWVKSLDPSETIQWLYSIQASTTVMHRLGLVNGPATPGGVLL